MFLTPAPARLLCCVQVTDKKVRGWDDPRLATINGLRRRGYPPEAINAFCREIGVTRNSNTIMSTRLENCIRTWPPHRASPARVARMLHACCTPHV
ncbi:hypothetical protein EON67_05145 [archaeon]|nr:MAG: hypothetical protein EON67_05145 [archaeon]